MALTRIDLPGEKSRAQELYAYLRGAIVSGELQPGERLVENRIAQLAAVSRTPVREALHRLEVDGLVRESDRGLEVCEFSLDEMADLCAVRETLEGMAASLAAISRSETDVVMLRRILEADVRAVAEHSDAAVQVRLNHSFHETIWNASRNRHLTGELRTLRELIERMQDTTLRFPARQAEALKNTARSSTPSPGATPAGAEAAARQHFQNAMIARLTMAGDDAVFARR